jgi:hypothetical protein
MTAKLLSDLCLLIVAAGGLSMVCGELAGIFSRVRIDR